MKIQIASDLHLEFVDNYIYIVEEKGLKPVGDVLVLAGDIFNYSNPLRFNVFMNEYADKFEKVIMIGGNHEWYKSIWGEGNIPESRENLVYLNNSTYEYKGVRFIGSTFWSGATPSSARHLNDYYVIGGFDVKTENKAHEGAKKFLKKELKKPFDGKTVVVTHHLPLWECVDPLYAGSPMNNCFASDQTETISSHDIDMWIHGHSHSFQDFTFHGTRVVRNPLGYSREWADWKPDFVCDL